MPEQIMHVRLPTRAFEDAIASGVLTTTIAHHYMYMYTHRYKGDAFKHIDTKEYIYNNKIRYKLGG